VKTLPAHAQNSADNALFAHAHADQRVPVTFLGQEFDHGDVVGERGGGADDFVEVGGVGAHFLERFVELLGRPEVVEGEDQGGTGAQLLQLLGLALAGGLEFDINQLAACGCGLAQNVELGGDGAAELASAGDAAAGGDYDRAGVGLHETLDSGQSQAGLRKVV